MWILASDLAWATDSRLVRTFLQWWQKHTPAILMHRQDYKIDRNANRYCYAQQFIECFVFHVLSPDFYVLVKSYRSFIVFKVLVAIGLLIAQTDTPARGLRLRCLPARSNR